MKRKNVTRRELATSIDNQLGVSYSNASEIVDKFFSIMKDTMASGESIKLIRFGTLTVNDKGQRLGRNPKTGETMMIKKRQMVSFRPSKQLKKILNHETGDI